MSEGPRSAAASIYPNLPSTDRALVQREQRDLAAAMYPRLARAPKPQPPPHPLLPRLKRAGER